MSEKMTLSEAIQLGATLRPQTYGAFNDSDGTCAMGAALEAVGKLAKTNNANARRIKKIWPWVNWRFELSSCPWCGLPKSFKSIVALLIHWNDDHHGFRQTIADYVFRIEEQAKAQINLLKPAERKSHLLQLEANLSCRSKKVSRKEPSAVTSVR